MSDKNGNIPDYADQNCTLCRFYSNTNHYCYRYPQVVPKDQLLTMTNLDWCGEFQLRRSDE